MTETELFSLPIVDGLQEPLAHNRFVGRSMELSKLVSIFGSRESASVLVAGYRGAGKTALVEEALRRATQPGKRIVVRLTPPHLGNGEPAQIRAQVLRSLARGLHFATASRDDVAESTKTQIREIYDKTYLTELESTRLLESMASTESRAAHTTTLKTAFDP